MRTTIQLGFTFILAVMLSGQTGDNMKAFGPAPEGMVRYVIQLPQQADETAFRVQLIVGKTVETDARNRYFFAGRIQSETVQGWGFTQYKVADMGAMAGTRMAVPPDAPKVSRFITLSGEPYLIRYNSKIPVVLYVPKDAEVKYRIWSAGAETLPAKQG